jgi:hypothetical protein
VTVVVSWTPIFGSYPKEAGQPPSKIRFVHSSEEYVVKTIKSERDAKIDKVQASSMIYTIMMISDEPWTRCTTCLAVLLSKTSCNNRRKKTALIVLRTGANIPLSPHLTKLCQTAFNISVDNL